MGLYDKKNRCYSLNAHTFIFRSSCVYVCVDNTFTNVEVKQKNRCACGFLIALWASPNNAYTHQPAVLYRDEIASHFTPQIPGISQV